MYSLGGCRRLIVSDLRRTSQGRDAGMLLGHSRNMLHMCWKSWDQHREHAERHPAQGQIALRVPVRRPRIPNKPWINKIGVVVRLMTSDSDSHLCAQAFCRVTQFMLRSWSFAPVATETRIAVTARRWKNLTPLGIRNCREIRTAKGGFRTEVARRKSYQPEAAWISLGSRPRDSPYGRRALYSLLAAAMRPRRDIGIAPPTQPISDQIALARNPCGRARLYRQQHRIAIRSKTTDSDPTLTLARVADPMEHHHAISIFRTMGGETNV